MALHDWELLTVLHRNLDLHLNNNMRRHSTSLQCSAVISSPLYSASQPHRAHRAQSRISLHARSRTPSHTSSCGGSRISSRGGSRTRSCTSCGSCRGGVSRPDGACCSVRDVSQSRGGVSRPDGACCSVRDGSQCRGEACWRGACWPDCYCGDHCDQDCGPGRGDPQGEQHWREQRQHKPRGETSL